MEKKKSALCAVVQLLSHVWFFVTPWTAGRSAPLSFTISQSLLWFMSVELIILSNHLILCCPLLLLPSTFPSISIFSNESALCIRWPKYWSFSVTPSNIQDWFPLGLTALISLQSRRLARVFLSITIRKNQFFDSQASLWSNSHICTWLLGELKLWWYGPLLANWCLSFWMHCLGLS